METSEAKLEAMDLNQQGRHLLEAGNLEGAREKFDRAIDMEPMLMDSYKNYGDLYMAMQEYKEAKNLYKKALLIEKKGELYFLIGNACFMADDVHEGLENYNQAISAGYDGEDMLFFMGMAYEHLNDDSMALRYFQKACNKNPSRPDFVIKKITTYVRMNMLEDAETNADELIKSSPELFDGYHIKIQLLLNKGDYEAAADFAKEASGRFPEDSDLMYDYAKCVALTKKYEEASRLIEQAKRMKYFENSKRNFIMLEAQVAAEQGDVEKAMQCCRESIELDTEEYFDAEARFMLMNLCLTKPDFEGAMGYAEELIRKKQEDSYYFAALYYRPYCLKQLGRTEEAQKLYKEANSFYRLITLKKPEATDAYLYRAMCLKDLEEYDKSLELLEFVDSVAGDIAEVHTLRAEIYRALGKQMQAEEEMQKAYEKKPELKELYEKGGEK